MPSYYCIRVHGYLDPSWSAWFDGLTITHDADGATTLRGPVVDQAALYGLIGTLIVAVSTVKKHVNNIFGKLEVESRTQAVMRACPEPALAALHLPAASTVVHRRAIHLPVHLWTTDSRTPCFYAMGMEPLRPGTGRNSEGRGATYRALKLVWSYPSWYDHRAASGGKRRTQTTEEHADERT